MLLYTFRYYLQGKRYLFTTACLFAWYMEPYQERLSRKADLLQQLVIHVDERAKKVQERVRKSHIDIENELVLVGKELLVRS